MNRIHTNEKGLVSITVTVVLMLVISITVLSFAQIIRREQRQALDSQLSSQAFYAAESGINDARQYIKDNYAGQVPKDKFKCDNSEGTYNLPMTMDTATNTGYSCVLVTGSPKSLTYSLSTSAASKVFPVDAGQAIDTLEVSWTPSTQNQPLNGCATPATAGSALKELPTAIPQDDTSSTAPKWTCNGYGMLRMDVVPFPTTGTTSRNDVMARTFTAFMMPVNSTAGNPTVSYLGNGTNVNGGQANQGARPTANCNLDSCKISITGLSADRYYVRASTLYRDTTLSVVAKSSGVAMPLRGAQIMIDATGRSQDVLKRIQVRVPLIGDGLHSDYGIQSTDSMCKQFTTYPGDPNTSGVCP